MSSKENIQKQPLLEIKNLKKEFVIKGGFLNKSKKTLKAVNDVSLKVYENEILGLVGESGCGKSTLGRTILKLYEPSAGQILFEGQDITKFTPRQMLPLRKEIQMVFQDPFSSLNPRMTVGGILAEPLLVHKMVSAKNKTEKVAHLLETVGLRADDMMKFPHEFSGGQRQRIGIARALAVEPKLIIADEPVSALDISILAQIINLLMDIRKKMGLAMIFIAHDLKVVEHISDRICVMYLGKVMESFPAQNLNTAKHPYTESLIQAIPIADPTLRKQKKILEGEIPSPISPPKGCVFHTRCPSVEENCKIQIPELSDFNVDHQFACDVIAKKIS